MPAPKLPRDKLLAAAAALRHAPLDSGVAREVMAILLEAATPDRHASDRLEGAQGARVRATERALRDHTGDVLRRAADRLRAIRDDEWAALVAEATREAGDAAD